MDKIKFGITGQSGFIGSHLFRKAVLNGHFQCVEFCRDFFDAPEAMRQFTSKCDVIVHLAGLSRHEDGELLYRTNVELTQKLIDACDGSQKILLGSTTHETEQLPYHASKRKSRELLEQYGNTIILLMANTFGPGSKPFYNSVVSTFCQMAQDGATPQKIDSAILKLIFVDDLCSAILDAAKTNERTGKIEIPHKFEYSLPILWKNLQKWHEEEIPVLKNEFECQLYFTLKSYQRRNEK